MSGAERPLRKDGEDANDEPRPDDPPIGTPIDASSEGTPPAIMASSETTGTAEGPALAAASGPDDADAPEAKRTDEAYAALLADDTDAPRAPDGLPLFPVDPDAHVRGLGGEYDAARIGLDPDSWRLAQRAREAAEEAARLAAMSKEPRPDPAVIKKNRQIFQILGYAAASFILVALVLHFAKLGPDGVGTWTMTTATGLVVAAAWIAPKCDFRPRLDGTRVAEAADWRRRQQLVMNGFSIGFALFVVAIGFIESMALLVAIGAIKDLSASSITFAINYIVVPAAILSGLVAGLFVRTKVPSNEAPVRFERPILWSLFGLFALASLVASVIATGVPVIERFSGLIAKQGIYIQSLGLAAAVGIVNIRLGYPNVLRIIQREIQRSKDVDRRGAEKLRKNMLRNYMIALLFVVGSIMFLVTNAAGLVKTEGSNNLDVILIVYLMFGILFLGMLFVNYYQSQQIRHKVMRAKKGAIVGKRRFRPEEVTRYTILGVSGTLTLIFLLLTVMVGSGKLTNLMGFEVGRRFGTDLFVLAVLSALGPYGFYYARESARIQTIDEKFPDFLRDLAESQRAGMTLPRALLTSSKGAYGPLTKEIRIMAAQVEWGISFQEALKRFADRTRTPLIERTVALVCEAAASGGNVVDILAAASDDAREIRNILTDRKTQMGIYSMIVYIAFLVFLAVVGVLNSQFIPELAASTKDVAGQQVGGIKFSEIHVPTYQRLFFHAALIQGIGGGLVSGVMTEGKPLAGLRHSFIMTLIAYAAFRLFIT